MIIDMIKGTIQKGSQKVNVVKVENLSGYRFDAIGRESLDLAVELAVRQTQKGQREIDLLLGGK